MLNELYLKVLIFIGSFHSTSTAPETCHTEHTSIFFQLSKLWLVEVTQGFDSSKIALAQKKETFAKNLINSSHLKFATKCNTFKTT